MMFPTTAYGYGDKQVNGESIARGTPYTLTTVDTCAVCKEPCSRYYRCMECKAWVHVRCCTDGCCAGGCTE